MKNVWQEEGDVIATVGHGVFQFTQVVSRFDVANGDGRKRLLLGPNVRVELGDDPKAGPGHAQSHVQVAVVVDDFGAAVVRVPEGHVVPGDLGYVAVGQHGPELVDVLLARAVPLGGAHHVDATARQIPAHPHAQALAVDHGEVLGLDDGQNSLPLTARAQGRHVRTQELDLVHPAHVHVDAAALDAAAQETVAAAANAYLHAVLPGHFDDPGHVLRGHGHGDNVGESVQAQPIVYPSSHFIMIWSSSVDTSVNSFTYCFGHVMH